MPEIRQILVPVDFSPCSMAALEQAGALSKPLGAAIDLLHVWEIPSFAPPVGIAHTATADQTLVDLLRGRAEQAMAGLLAEARSRGIEIRSTRCDPGVVAPRVLEAARDGGYDLIVAGTHGRTGLSRFLIGSVAERLVRHAPCPVLTVRSSE